MKLSRILLPLAALTLIGWTAAKTFQDQPLPTVEPTAEHLLLKKLAGTWDSTVNFMGGTTKGVYTVELAMNRLWIIENFKGEFGGLPFHGHGVTGYDPAKKKYVGVWVDSISTHIQEFEGDYDAKQDAFVFETMGTNMATGEKQREIHRTTFHGADAATFEMVVPQPDGSEAPLMTIEYARKK